MCHKMCLFRIAQQDRDGFFLVPFLDFVKLCDGCFIVNKRRESVDRVGRDRSYPTSTKYLLRSLQSIFDFCVV